MKKTTDEDTLRFHFEGTLKFVLCTLLALSHGGLAFAARQTFDIEPWPDGIVRYKFDNGALGPKAVTSDDQTKVQTEMARWVTALSVPDPLSGGAKKYIRFEECTNCPQDCPADVLVIRYNHPHEEDSNMCKVGMNSRDILPRTCTTLRMGEDEFRHPNTARHELGHCLGLWHEFNRADADQWLVETPDEDGEDFSECPDGQHAVFAFCTKADLMPMLGNYDYDSLMHYSFDGVTDRPGNQFGRVNLDRGKNPVYVSERDKSRLLQYYAWERYPNWGFFKSLSRLSPAANTHDLMPNPYLTGQIEAVGTPAIAFQSPGNIDFFARGSDNNLYWASSRNGVNFPWRWISLGCCFSSDPSAISRREGQLDVVAIEADTGKLIYKHYEDGTWGTARYVQGGYPSGGIKHTKTWNYIGPAIASRAADSLDVFVVRSDGRLALTTLRNGEWSKWGSLGDGYNVTARPAAAALSATKIQLAINESDYKLYEPVLTTDSLPFFTLGNMTANTAYQAPPALTKRSSLSSPYRVLITNAQGRLSHKFANDFWRDIGGIPKTGTGPSAVSAGGFSTYVLINGEDARGCASACLRDSDSGKLVLKAVPAFNAFIQPGGLWLRSFD